MTESNNSSMRWVVLAAVLGLAVIWFGFSRMGKGWLFPIRVGSASMAPALLGPRLQLNCDDCQFPIAIGFDSTTNDAEYVCPNCGHFGNTDHAEAVDGQRVRIYPLARPRRFDVVVAQSDDELITKRVVGLPGETVGIVNGDLVVDGEIVCKTGTQLVNMSIVVHQDRYRSTSDSMSQRWRSMGDSTNWTATDDGHVWRLVKGANEANRSWLTYHHSEALPPPYQRGSPAPVTDNCPYNQGTSRVLNRVSDCFLTLTAEWQTGGTIYFRRNSPNRSWTVEFATSTGSLALVCTSWEGDSVVREVVAEAQTEQPPSLSSLEHSFLFGFCDGHFQFMIDGIQLIQHPVDVSEALTKSTQPFSIAVKSINNLELRDLMVIRDIYYTDAYGTHQPWALGRKLENDEYLTLGDNSPVSRDSRHNEVLGVFRRAQFMGQVKQLPRMLGE